MTSNDAVGLRRFPQEETESHVIPRRKLCELLGITVADGDQIKVMSDWGMSMPPTRGIAPRRGSWSLASAGARPVTRSRNPGQPGRCP
jgi:hypothetical protein